MSVDDWLLDGDPAIRWQTMRDLGGATADDVATERARVEHEGWGARLLALEDPDGLWDGGACFPALYRGDEPGQPWTATMHTLQTLQLLGLDPASPSARRAIALVAQNGRWEHAGQRYFDGEVEPCINGRTIDAGAYFGVDVSPIVERILGERLADGGWNCEAENGSARSSFDTTLNVLDGLLEFERATGGSEQVRAARRSGEEYLLERGLFRRRTTGEVAKPAYLEFAFPHYWRYDVLRALDYVRRSGRGRDPRLAEAVEVVRSKRQADGRWLLDRIHPGRVHFDLEGGVGTASRWNTLRALRVLDWWDRLESDEPSESFAAWREACVSGRYDHHDHPHGTERFLVLRVLAREGDEPEATWLHGRYAPGSDAARALELERGPIAAAHLPALANGPGPGIGAALLTMTFVPDVMAPIQLSIGPMGAPPEGLVPASALVAAAHRFLSRAQ